MKNPISKPIFDNSPKANPMALTRDLTPLFDQNVDQWLRHFADSADFEKLEKWLASITTPGARTPILLLSGPPGTGKTLLTVGVSRLWTTTGPTRAASSTKDFKRSIANCPLVVVEGELTATERGRILSLPWLIVTTNHYDFSSLTSSLTPEQGEAIASRTCLVRSRIEAAEFLRGVDTRRFVEDDTIARHVLWLRENRHERI